jgi:hypothetical protein
MLSYSQETFNFQQKQRHLMILKSLSVTWKAKQQLFTFLNFEKNLKTRVENSEL